MVSVLFAWQRVMETRAMPLNVMVLNVKSELLHKNLLNVFRFFTLDVRISLLDNVMTFNSEQKHGQIPGAVHVLQKPGICSFSIMIF